MKFQTPFNHSKTVMFSCMTPSVTEQQFEFELNINNINSCNVSALPPDTRQAIYNLSITGDEYEKQLNATAEVQNYFEQIPAKAKDYFHYNIKEFLNFIQDSNNFDKAHDLGLIDDEHFNAVKSKDLTKNLTELVVKPSEVISEPEINQTSAG